MPSATATLTCDLGLAASGVSTLTCTEEGWSPSVGFGECRTGQSGLNCQAVNVQGGTVMYIQANNAVPYSAGTSVFLMCNISYTPQGSMSAMCQNGSWTPPLGSCLASSQNGSNNLITGQQSGMNSGNAGNTCIAIAAPLNGYVNYSQNAS
ncbi:sushi domain protein, partial [Ostertagia ostertagi]